MVSNDAGNRAAGIVTVVPLTSNVERILPFEVLLDSAATGSGRNSEAWKARLSASEKRGFEMHEPTAKLFTTGGSQAVRLPAEFRFEDATEVYIRRDEATGDVILSVHAPTNWASFMKRRSRIGPAVLDEYLQPVERAQSERTRDPFEGWQD